jgi:hypothetical protein
MRPSFGLPGCTRQTHPFLGGSSEDRNELAAVALILQLPVLYVFGNNQSEHLSNPLLADSMPW